MNRFDILKDIIPVPEVKKEISVDKTTMIRFEYAFDKDSEIREAYHEETDITLRLNEKLKKQVEDMVMDWLDGYGVEQDRLQIDFKNDQGEFVDFLLFMRYEVAVRTCSNNWEIHHLAQSGLWPRIISSKPKLLIQKSCGDFMVFKNGIESIDNETLKHAQKVLISAEKDNNASETDLKENV